MDVKLSVNTIDKHIQMIKLVMNEANETGTSNSVAHKSNRFITVKEKISQHLPGKKSCMKWKCWSYRFAETGRVRDLFLIGCYTGLRYSDYSILKPEDIRNGFIQVTQIKTDSPVTIPLHDTVVSIINKYNGSLPASISNQETNDYLKEIGRMIPSLENEVLKSFTKEGSKQQTRYKKWKCLLPIQQGGASIVYAARRQFRTEKIK